MICLNRLGNTLWFLGHPEAATRSRDAALALAEEIGQPYTHAVALVFAAMLALEMRDLERLREYAARLTVEHAEHEARQVRGVADILDGYIEVLDGREEIGIARIQRVLDDERGPNPAPGVHATFVRVLLEACTVAGDARAGLAAAERVLEMDGGARVWEAEARRLRAEFLAALGASEEDVEAELERALQVARRQGARLFELRATASLLRHRMERGDGPWVGEARVLLAAIVDGFPERSDTRDLREAAGILAQT